MSSAGAASWGEVEKLFWDALSVPFEERAAFVFAATDDAQIRREVELLLAAHLPATSGLGLAVPGRTMGNPTKDTFSINPGDILCDRYEVVRELGRGGMGRVYEAHDRELDEQIAIKTIQPFEEEIDQAFDRLKRELRVMRRLTHPNICRVFDISRGCIGGRDILLFTMELLRGQTIAQRLVDQKRFPLEEVREILRQVASALATAHSNGIVHRDLKPSNIMLTDRGDGCTHAVIMDFGIARRIAAVDRLASAVSMNMDGWGTPAYMAPEQLTGQAITAATDTYSLGLVLYEMICGERAFSPSAEFGWVLKRLQENPLDPRSHVGDLPEGWRRLLIACLQREPGRRPQSLEHRLPAFRPLSKRRISSRFAIFLLLLIVAGAGAYWMEWRWNRSLTLDSHVERVAMLPFSPANDKSEDDAAIIRGVSAAISNRLAVLIVGNRSLAWISDSDLRSQHVTDLAGARRQLGADLVFSGSVEKQGNLLRGVLSLVNARTGNIVRAVTVTGQNYGSLESQMGQAAVQELRIKNGELAAQKSAVPAAESNYLRSLGLMERSDQPDALAEASSALHSSVVQDPNFLPARIELARVLRTEFERTKQQSFLTEGQKVLDDAAKLAPRDPSIPLMRGELLVAKGDYQGALGDLAAAEQQGLHSCDLFIAMARADDALGLPEKAEENFSRGLREQPNSWSVYSYIAAFHYRRGAFEKSAAEFERALAIAPDNARVLYSLGGVMLQLHRYKESRTYLLKAAAIHPTAPVWINLGSLYADQLQWTEAAAAYERALEFDSTSYKVWESLAKAYDHLPGEHDKSQDGFRRAAAICTAKLSKDPGNPAMISDLSTYLAFTGKRQEALELIQKALALAPANLDTMVNAGEAYEALGFRTEALEWVGRALAKGFPADDLSRDMALDNLRTDARYSELIHSSKNR